MNRAFSSPTVADARTVTLDEVLPLTKGRVRLIVEPLTGDTAPSYRATMKAIRERQSARGHQPSKPGTVEAYLQAERASWTDGP